MTPRLGEPFHLSGRLTRVGHMLRAVSISLLIVPLWCVLAAGQTASVVRLDGSTITPAEIDKTVNRLMAAAKVTGIGIAILNNRRLVYLKAFGSRDVASNLPLTPDSVMTAASYTKSTFALMVMQLVQAGILDLDKPIRPVPAQTSPELSGLSGSGRRRAAQADHRAHAAEPHGRLPQSSSPQ